MFLGIVLGIVSGFAIMGGSGLLVAWVFRAALGGKKPTEKENIIMTTLIVGIWFVLWINGSSDWTDYDGSINFGNVFVSLLMNPIEIVSGLEHLLNLEAGALGGW